MNRRRFLELLASVGAATVMRPVRAFAADLSEPLLFTMGLMTDTHVGSGRTKTAERVKKAVELFLKLGVDAITNVGDICDAHKPEDYAAYRAGVDEVLASAKKRPPEYFAYAWHDSYAYKGHPRTDSQKDAPEAFADVQKYLRAANAPNDQIEIAGIPMLFFHQFADSVKECEPMIVAAELRYPGKPILVIDHVPAWNTTYNSIEWGNLARRQLYDRHPRVVQISGHTHGSLRNECNIWQGAFTEVNVGCLQVWGKDSINNFDVMRLEVREHSLVFRRYDIRTGEEIGADAPWIVPLPFDAATAPYSLEARRSRSLAPEFAVGAALTAFCTTDNRKRKVLRLSFPKVTGENIPYLYRAKVTGRTATGEPVLLVSESSFSDFYLPRAERTDLPVFCDFPPYRLEPGEKAQASVVPEGFSGRQGRALTCELVGPSRKSETVYETLDPMKDLTMLWGGLDTPVPQKDGYYSHPRRMVARLMLPTSPTRGTDPRRVLVTIELCTKTTKENIFAARITSSIKPDANPLSSRVEFPDVEGGLMRVVFEYAPTKDDVPHCLYIFSANTDPCAVRFERVRIERG